MRPAAIHARTNVSDVISSAITTSPHKYSANRRTSLENRSYRFSMSVILFATQVTGEHAKGYIEGTHSGSSAAGSLGICSKSYRGMERATARTRTFQLGNVVDCVSGRSC